MSSFGNFLLFCSGANREILKRPECVHDRARFKSIGATILLTAVYSFLSAVYTMTLVVDTKPLAVLGGLVWALLVFAIDRLLISSLQNRPLPLNPSVAERIRLQRGNLVLAVPRLLLAAFIGATLTMPLELRLFEDLIEEHIRNDRTRTLTNIQARVTSQFPDIDRIARATAQMELQLRLAQKHEDELLTAMLEEPSLAGRIFEERRRAFVKARSDSTTLKRLIEPAIARNSERLSTLRSAARERQARLTRMIALRSSDSVVDRIETLRELSAQNHNVRAMSLLLFSTVLLVQLMPVLTKLLLTSGPYDEFWETFEAMTVTTGVLNVEDTWNVSNESNESAVATTSNLPYQRQPRVEEIQITRNDCRALRAFICHSSEDKEAARGLSERLKTEAVDPWLDDEMIMPGQDWDHEIRQAIRTCDIVIVCLSRTSVMKTGYVQKEIKFAIDVAAEQPDGSTFLIPAKLEKCDIPARLQALQYVKLFEHTGYDRLRKALRNRALEKGLRLGL
jgi:hypothetical protein